MKSMVTLKGILGHVPIIGMRIWFREREEAYQRAYHRRREEVYSKVPEARRRILTISPEQLASMQGKRIEDYEPIGMQVTSPETYDVEYSRDCALVNLFDAIRQDGIEYVVSVNFETTTTTGMGTIRNPHGYRTSVYGTGMRLREDKKLS